MPEPTPLMRLQELDAVTNHDDVEGGAATPANTAASGSKNVNRIDGREIATATITEVPDQPEPAGQVGENRMDAIDDPGQRNLRL